MPTVDWPLPWQQPPALFNWPYYGPIIERVPMPTDVAAWLKNLSNFERDTLVLIMGLMLEDSREKRDALVTRFTDRYLTAQQTSVTVEGVGDSK